MSKLWTAGGAALVTASLLWQAGPALAEPDIDVTPPTVVSTGLSDGQLAGHNTYLDAITTDDVGVTRVQYFLNGVLVRPEVSHGGRRTWLVIPQALHNQDADITVRAWDRAGNHGEATTRVRVDTEYPRATITPALESFVGGVVAFAVTDIPDDLVRVSIWDDRANLLARTTEAPWTMSWDSAGRNGALWVEYKLTDRAGNTTVNRGFLAVDNTAPVVQRVDFPTVPGQVRGRSRLVAYVIDDSPINRVEWRVDGVLRATSLTSPYAFDWDTATANGPAALEVSAYDGLGNVSVLKRTVTVDNTPPTISSAYPGNGALIRGAFRTGVTATDPAGLAPAKLSIDGGRDGVFTVARSPFGQLVPAAGRDGAKRLQWTITDRLGNSTTVVRTATLDNTRPAVRFVKAPANRAKVKGTIKITAAAGDRNGVSRVELLVNNKVVAKDLKAGYAFSILARKYGRKFTVRLRATDRAGNVSYTPNRTWRR